MCILYRFAKANVDGLAINCLINFRLRNYPNLSRPEMLPVEVQYFPSEIWLFPAKSWLIRKKKTANVISHLVNWTTQRRLS